MQADISELRNLLSAYRFWGVAAVVFFALFMSSMLAVQWSIGVKSGMLLVPLCAGFLWIGSTALSRHSLVRLNQYIGREIGLFEFVSTQFVFVLFPFFYGRLKREVSSYARRHQNT